MDNNILEKLHNEEIQILDEIVKVCKNNNLTYFLIGGTLLGAIRHNGFIPWDDDLDIAMPRKDYEKFLKIANSQLSSKYRLEYFKNIKKSYNTFAKVKNINTIYEEKKLKDYDGSKGMWVDIFPLDYSNRDNGLWWELKGKIIYYMKCMADIKYGNYERKNFIKGIAKDFIYYCIPTKIIMNCLNLIMKSNKNEKSKYFINYGSKYGIKRQTHLKEKYLPSIQKEFEGKKYDVPNDFDYVLTKIYGKDYMQLPPMEKRITHNPIKIKFENEEEILFYE